MKPDTEAKREAFLRTRTEIGASEAAAVLGVDAYKGPDDVYDRITALRDHDEVLESERTAAMQRGIHLEPIVARLYAQRTGRKIRAQSTPDRCREFEHLQANPDREVLASDSEGTGLLEVKCPGVRIFDYLKDNGLPDSWNVQGQAQLACRPKIGYVEYAIHNAERWETLIVRIERHEEFIGQLLVPRLREFWERHIEPRARPEAVVEPVPLPPSWNGEVEVIESAPLQEAIARYAEAKQMATEIQGIVDARKGRLVSLLGDAQGVACGPWKVLHRWVMPKTGRLDTKRLAAFLREHGMSLEQFRADPKPYRVLRKPTYRRNVA